MSQELKAMTRELKIKGHQCGRCGKAFTSTMRLEHHVAAEHTIRTSRDICTTRCITHRPQTSHDTADGHRA